MKTRVEPGLRAAMAERRDASFKLKDGSVGGNGLAQEFRNANWDQVRDAAYGGRIE